MSKKSLFRRLLITVCLLFVSFGALLMFYHQYFSEHPIALLMLTAGTLLLLIGAFRWHLTPIWQAISALDSGINSLKDNDFSLTIYDQQYREVSNVIGIYNELTTILRNERMDIFQRELLLDTVIQSTPVALVLTTSSGTIVYNNLAAKELFKQPQINGCNLFDIYQQLVPALRTAIDEKTNGFITDIIDEQNVIFHVNCQQFMLNGSEHSLYLLKNITTEISQQEANMWKQVIRLISHELNNSLAPIASLTRSAKKIIANPEHVHMLNDVLETIANRTDHLHQFISQYAKFAKLPKPMIAQVELAPFLQQLATLVQVKCKINVSSQYAKLDAGQIEQVVINLVKNAKESGSDEQEVGVDISQQANLLTFSIYDRGSGLTESQMHQALLPFFTTKSTGSGVGLALCNEIVTNHGGKLRLANRQHGGLCVSFSLVLA